MCVRHQLVNVQTFLGGKQFECIKCKATFKNVFGFFDSFLSVFIELMLRAICGPLCVHKSLNASTVKKKSEIFFRHWYFWCFFLSSKNVYFWWFVTFHYLKKALKNKNLEEIQDQIAICPKRKIKVQKRNKSLKKEVKVLKRNKSPNRKGKIKVQIEKVQAGPSMMWFFYACCPCRLHSARMLPLLHRHFLFHQAK